MIKWVRKKKKRERVMKKRNEKVKNYSVSAKLHKVKFYQNFLRKITLGTDVMVGLNLL